MPRLPRGRGSLVNQVDSSRGVGLVGVDWSAAACDDLGDRGPCRSGAVPEAEAFELTDGCEGVMTSHQLPDGRRRQGRLPTASAWPRTSRTDEPRDGSVASTSEYRSRSRKGNASLVPVASAGRPSLLAVMLTAVGQCASRLLGFRACAGPAGKLGDVGLDHGLVNRRTPEPGHLLQHLDQFSIGTGCPFL